MLHLGLAQLGITVGRANQLAGAAILLILPLRDGPSLRWSQRHHHRLVDGPLAWGLVPYVDGWPGLLLWPPASSSGLRVVTCTPPSPPRTAHGRCTSGPPAIVPNKDCHGLKRPAGCWAARWASAPSWRFSGRARHRRLPHAAAAAEAGRAAPSGRVERPAGTAAGSTAHAARV